MAEATAIKNSNLLTVATVFIVLECIPVIGPIFFVPALIASIMARVKAPSEEVKTRATTRLIWSFAIVLIHGFLIGVISALQ